MALQSECHPVQFQTNYPPKKKKTPFSPSQVRTINLYRMCLQGRQPGTPLIPACGKPQKTRGSYHLHGKTRNSGCKIKWFAPSVWIGKLQKKIYGLCFEMMQFFHLFQLDIPLVVDHPLTRWNFMVLCLCTRFPPGWFCVNDKHPRFHSNFNSSFQWNSIPSSYYLSCPILRKICACLC